MIKYTTMKRMGLFKTVSLLLGCLTMFSCVDYDDIQPFTGKTLPRKSGYSTGVTNDWIYFNLRTGESFNTYTVNKDIKEGEQINRTDWDLAFCGYTMRTNSGTSGIGQGGAADLGYGGYDDWTSVSQLPSDLEWVVDTDDVRVTMSQNDWNPLPCGKQSGLRCQPVVRPHNGPATTETNANPLLSQAMSFSGPPPTYTPSFHTYVVRTADGERYFKIQIISWYDANVEIGDEGGRISYYCDELK